MYRERLTPPEPDEAYCPVCGSMCGTYYIVSGEIVGCEECVELADAFEYNAERRAEQAEFYREMMRDV